MEPIIQEEKFKPRHYAIYATLIILCMIAIGIAVYFQYFQDEKLGVIFGITSEEVDEEYEQLKENFTNIFTNDFETINGYNGNIKKIAEDKDIVIVGYSNNDVTEDYTLNVQMPYFNINSEVAKKFNAEIRETFRDKAESIMSSSGKNIIYTVKYKAYLDSDILSLAIWSELKEDTNSQRIIMQTYNYNIKEEREVSIDEIIQKKNIDIGEANKKIKEEVDLSQEQNIKLQQMGYNTNVRDSNSDEYKIQNASEFFLGANEYLYVVYPYGNNEYTSEMDLIIFR